MRAKRTIKKFDLVKLILPLKFMSLGSTMVILRDTFVYEYTPTKFTLKRDSAEYTPRRPRRPKRVESRQFTLGVEEWSASKGEWGEKGEGG